MEDINKTVLDTALKWWTAELERAEQFLTSEDWESGTFGKERPTLREVLESLEQFDSGEWDTKS